MYKLVVLDLDGTLLNNDSKISSYSKKVLLELVAKDIKVVLASGRPYQSMLPFAEELNLKTPLISNNGALIKRPSGETIEEKFIDTEYAKDIVDYAKNRGLHVSVYFPDQICVERITKRADVHIKEEKVRPQAVGNLKQELDRAPINILFNIDENLMLKTIRDLDKQFGSDVSIAQTSDNYIDIMGQNVNKGLGVKFLLKEYNLNLEEVIAFGNNYNDLEMIELAGCGVVTDNAPAEIKDEADRVTTSNQEDGVAKVLAELL